MIKPSNSIVVVPDVEWAQAENHTAPVFTKLNISVAGVGKMT